MDGFMQHVIFRTLKTIPYQHVFGAFQVKSTYILGSSVVRMQTSGNGSHLDVTRHLRLRDSLNMEPLTSVSIGVVVNDRSRTPTPRFVVGVGVGVQKFPEVGVGVGVQTPNSENIQKLWIFRHSAVDFSYFSFPRFKSDYDGILDLFTISKQQKVDKNLNFSTKFERKF